MVHQIVSLAIFSSAAAVVGICCAAFAHKIPSRGWIGVVLLLIAALAFILIEAGTGLSSIPMSMLFLFTAPIATVYSFRAKKRAPDHLVALAAFTGSFIIGAFFLFMVAGLVLLIMEICSHAA